MDMRHNMSNSVRIASLKMDILAWDSQNTKQKRSQTNRDVKWNAYIS
jgi:hypothetical protein